jgi:hypothetical protein
LYPQKHEKLKKAVKDSENNSLNIKKSWAGRLLA